MSNQTANPSGVCSLTRGVGSTAIPARTASRTARPVLTSCCVHLQYRRMGTLRSRSVAVRPRVVQRGTACRAGYIRPVDTVTLYRPVGPSELELIEASDWREFPPRLPDQPIFYPVIDQPYARQIPRYWNVPPKSLSYNYRQIRRPSRARRYSFQQRRCIPPRGPLNL